MSESAAIEKLLSWIRSQIGYHEGAGNQNKFAPMVAAAIGWDAQGQPWCSVFVIAAMIACFGLDKACAMLCTAVGQASAACRANADAFKAAGRFSRFPKVGDQIFFYYSGDINHTGFVEAVNGNSVTTIEGNSSDGVRRNTYSLSDPVIAGYGTPRWDLVADVDQPAAGDEKKEDPPGESTGFLGKIIDFIKKPGSENVFNLNTSGFETVILHKGDGMNDPRDIVKVAQMLLKLHGQFLDADGEFGFQTEQAVKSFQCSRNLSADGVVGINTWIHLILFSVSELKKIKLGG